MVIMKKAQLKIQQMAFMLIAVTLFFVLVGMFVIVIKFSGLRGAAESLEDQNAMLLATKIANSPEFSCGNSFGSNKINCVDMDKVMILKQNIKKYDKFWGVENIEIRKIYPDKDSETECEMANYPNCGIIKLRDDIEIDSVYSNYITLCYKEADVNGFYDKCEMARIMIDPRDIK